MYPKYSFKENTYSLTKLDPRTSYGRIYTISKEETKAATEQFKCMLNFKAFLAMHYKQQDALL